MIAILILAIVAFLISPTVGFICVGVFGIIMAFALVSDEEREKRAKIKARKEQKKNAKK